MIKEISFSKKAVEKINQLISKKPSGTFFRISVKGGGCSGFQYTWGLSETKTNDEIIDDILLLDPMAIMYVIGSKIDYITELGGSYLAVVNPTAKSSCGCGESFAV